MILRFINRKCPFYYLRSFRCHFSYVSWLFSLHLANAEFCCTATLFICFNLEVLIFILGWMINIVIKHTTCNCFSSVIANFAASMVNMLILSHTTTVNAAAVISLILD
jgi:hypothetical protein